MKNEDGGKLIIELTPEEMDHFRDWRRLSNDEKEAITKLAKALGSEDRRKSLYSLIEAQNDISAIVVMANHIGWIGRVIAKAGVYAGVIIGIYTVYKILFLGGK